jgi:hypothetical protein
MKVYLVHNECYDYDTCTYNSYLFGIYSSMELAVSAREEFISAELEECAELCYNTQQSIDEDNNPTITKLDGLEPIEVCSYTIEEWTVQ